MLQRKSSIMVALTCVLTPLLSFAQGNGNVNVTIRHAPYDVVSVRHKTERGDAPCKYCSSTIRYDRTFKWDSDKHEWVETCSVVGTEAVKHFRGQTPYAFVKVKEGCPKSEAEIEKELRALCLKDLPEYMQPEYYSFVKELEYTAIGKVDIKKLEAMALEDVTSTVTA